LSKFIDLIGQRFEKLVVIERLENDKNGKTRWVCKCDCGKETVVIGRNLINNRTRSCGCGKDNVSKKLRKDLIGKRFGKLLVISPSHSVDGKWWWDCLCDCGQIIKARGYSLTSGQTQSCGCLRDEITTNRNKNNRWTDRKKIKLNQVFLSYKIAANKRGLKFELSKELFEQLIFGNCFYCGCEPKNETIGEKGIKCNGIDRVDNTVGYIESNVVTCCKDCNFGKRNKYKQDFLSWVERVYNHSIKEKEN
jgi:hypothetical protein